jgi:hypothetical protein
MEQAQRERESESESEREREREREREVLLTNKKLLKVERGEWVLSSRSVGGV